MSCSMTIGLQNRRAERGVVKVSMRRCNAVTRCNSYGCLLKYDKSPSCSHARERFYTPISQTQQFHTCLRCLQFNNSRDNNNHMCTVRQKTVRLFVIAPQQTTRWNVTNEHVWRIYVNSVIMQIVELLKCRKCNWKCLGILVMSVKIKCRLQIFEQFAVCSCGAYSV